MPNKIKTTPEKISMYLVGILCKKQQELKAAIEFVKVTRPITAEAVRIGVSTK